MKIFFSPLVWLFMHSKDYNASFLSNTHPSMCLLEGQDVTKMPCTQSSNFPSRGGGGGGGPGGREGTSVTV